MRIADEASSARAPRRRSPTGKVVGWFQGRMEWGPRALGNRSIVCDPRRADMKDILNLKIKRRESFRPFAPSILREAVTRLVRDRRRRAVHDAGLPDPRREARADPGRHARRRLGPPADGAPRSNPRYYAPDRGLRRASPACRSCSTPRSTRTSRSCARPRRRSTASCARRWTCSCWATRFIER